jgi:hypothetical protein
VGRLSTGLIDIIKKAATDAVNTGDPTDGVYGEVLEVSPLRIRVGERLSLGSSFFILTKNVTNHKVEISLDSEENEGEKETKEVVVKNGLKIGDKVLLLRLAGGQRYVVWDKV